MKKQTRKVSIISRESNSKTLDITMLEAELLKRGCDVTVLSRLLTKEKSIRALGYIGHVMRQEAAILASDVVVLDTYCIPASMIPHRKGTKVIQMWHALGAVKQFGWQTVGKEGGSSERTARLMRMHHGYDHVVCPSDVTAEYFCEAFRVGRGAIVKQGLPRIDYIKSVASGERHDETAAKIFAKYPQLRKGCRPNLTPMTGSGLSKMTLLYAPTFRRGKAVDVQSLVDALDPEKYDLVVKLHPLYRGDVSGDNGDAGGKKGRVCVIYDEEFSSYDWLSVADAVISDYSSYVIESTLADKPLFIYAYDLEDYAENTGLNIDFDSEPIAPYVFRDAKELAACIDRTCGGPENKEGGDADHYDLDALRAFRDRYIDINTDNCTAALADFIVSL